MKPSNRDLLVLSKKVSNEREMELEVEKLNQLLFHVESLENFCVVNEIVDINSYKIISNQFKIAKIVGKNKLKPFQFIHCKN